MSMLVYLVSSSFMSICMTVRVFSQRLFHEHHGASIWSNAVL